MSRLANNNRKRAPQQRETHDTETGDKYFISPVHTKNRLYSPEKNVTSNPKKTSAKISACAMVTDLSKNKFIGSNMDFQSALSQGQTRKYPQDAQRWSAEEDELLKQAVEEHDGKNWKKIASFLPGRTDVQCLHRWQKVLKPGLVKGPWTTEEDEVLGQLVASLGPQRWSAIAQQLNDKLGTTRLGKQCRERWHNHLDPSIKRGEWDEEEDRIVCEQQELVGNKWSEIAKLLPGRTENAVKNRWNSLVRKQWQQAYKIDQGEVDSVPVIKAEPVEYPAMSVPSYSSDCKPVESSSSLHSCQQIVVPNSDRVISMVDLAAVVGQHRELVLQLLFGDRTQVPSEASSVTADFEQRLTLTSDTCSTTYQTFAEQTVSTPSSSVESLSFSGDLPPIDFQFSNSFESCGDVTDLLHGFQDDSLDELFLC